MVPGNPTGFQNRFMRGPYVLILETGREGNVWIQLGIENSSFNDGYVSFHEKFD